MRPNFRRDRLVFAALFLAFQLIFGFALAAQNVNRITKHEVERRQAALPRGVAALARAQAAMQTRNYAVAHDEFRNALNLLPDAVTSAKAHDEALTGFSESGVKVAEQNIADGKFAEAESVVREMVEDRYDPNCRPALELLAHLQQPGYFNKTMGPKFIEKVEEVKKLLADADGYYNSGRYDLAFKKYEQVLAIDPYNTAARHGEEKIDNTKYNYNQEAYNESRARQLWQVEKGWEQPVKRYGKTVEPMTEAFQRDITGTARITQKLNTIIIPRVEFRDASVREAIDFLRQQAAANDPARDGKKGVDIVLRLAPLGQIAPPPIPVEPAQPAAGAPPLAGAVPPEGAPAIATPVPARPIVAPAVVAASAISPAEARITITLNQIPLGEALRYIASQAGLKVKVEPYAVSIIPISEQSNDLLTKEYRVPPGFISTSVNLGVSALGQGAYKTGAAAPAAAGAATTGTGEGTHESTGGHQLVNREGAREFLESQGVPFPPGASAHFLPQSSRLIVRNTADNLELVDAIVEQASVAGPKQVEIEAKFIEINQNNLKELGFDWLLGQFNIGNHKLFGGGGTSGQITGPGVPANSPNYPFAPPGGVPVGEFPVTAGNRSGNLAISANAIDALLFPTLGASSLAPGIFGLSGVFTDPQFQVVIRALNQKKGIDLLSAPKITTKSGQRAVIEIVREFRYPTQFTEPKVPDIQGRGSSSSTTTTIALPVVGPSTPSNFETRNTGVTLEVEPVVGPDGVTIDLNLVPQVVEFEGFINYGSPIRTVNPALLGFSPTTLLGTTTQAITLTDNVINQPIFSTRKVTTSVSVWDGQTVVLGGLMREDVQKVEDRTPFLGDIPMVGRLFRTNVDQHIKRNLIIFVTARLVNPAGQPVNQAEEEEEQETVQPPVLPEIPAYKK
ncbi:MAG TPA: Amuc_1098 family type IV pilus outer membrane protein [Chthoniobacterales bacterium]|nr:Amuc_1098 family type IV pilus outer membrane protein [Chthoniobacterales bacterium]